MTKEERYITTPNERLIKKIGGKVFLDYQSFKAAVEYFNYNCFELFYYLNLANDNDLNDMIKAAVDGKRGVFDFFYKRILEDIENGKIKKDKIINEKWIVDENTPDEEKLKKIKKEETEIHRACVYLYKKRLKDFMKAYNRKIYNCKINDFYFRMLDHLKSVLYVTKYGVKIDAQKYITVYTDYTKQSESIIGKLHKDVAKTINTFFGGLPITLEELKKYFKIKNGIVEININSINSYDYARLGGRILKIEKNEEK